MKLMNEAEQRLDSLCSRIAESDNTIRFVGISNKMGNLTTSRYRRGLIPLLTPEEIEKLAIEADHENILVNKILPLVNEEGL
jgi:hypothetical protein